MHYLSSEYQDSQNVIHLTHWFSIRNLIKFFLIFMHFHQKLCTFQRSKKVDSTSR